MSENHNLFTIASSWDTCEDSDRVPLRAVVTSLVGYDCKIACNANNGSVDIVILSIKTNSVTDWLEIQKSGAFGVIYEMYETSGSHPDQIQTQMRCDEYNYTLQEEFYSGSESEMESSDSYS